MEDIRVFRSPLFSSKRRSNNPSNSNARPTCEEEYDSDELNAKGAFNHSHLHIVETSQLVEPTGWYPGREYYVVTRGLAVGIFHDLAEVHRSVDMIASAQWVTCKTWKQAIKLWDLAYQGGTICLLREEIWDTSAATRRSTTRAPALQSSLGTPPVACNLVSENQTPVVQPSISGAPTSPPSVSKQRIPPVIDVSDCDSNSAIDVSDYDSDSEIEATYPKKIVKVYDCFEVLEGKDGAYLRQTYDAATDTHLDSPIKAEVAPCASSSKHCRAQFASSAAASNHRRKSSGPTLRQSSRKRAQQSSTTVQSAKKVKSKIEQTANKNRK